MALPGTPNNFIVQQGNAQVFLSWNTVLIATSYKVYRSDDYGSTYSVIASPTTPFYLDTTVTVATIYWYKVSAFDGTNESPATTPQQIIPTNTADMSLGQIRLNSQQRADRVNSQFVTTSEWNSYITQSYFELYDILIQKFGEDYFVAAPFQITTTGVNLYNLPTNIYKLLGVDLAINAQQNAWITLRRFNFIDRNRYVYPNVSPGILGISNMQYKLLGSQLMLIPPPSSAQTLQLWFIPKLTQPLQETDILSGVSGWTEYVIIDSAIKALQKEESDVSILGAQKQMMIQRIEAAAENRDAGQPSTISDVNGSGPWGRGYQDWGGPMAGW